jgi:phosphopantothenoylcysteine decarboxylase/phosphopantothenate--cysteine ligase
MNVLVGVSGSIAAYRAADVVRDLMRAGCDVRVCLTEGASEFVRPALFEGLTGNPCLTHAFEEPVRGKMAHIELARFAQAILICPASAHAIARIARGEALDMLTTVIVASKAQLVLAPAMNPQMYASDSVQSNLKTLKDRGAVIVAPQEGDVACGEHGEGKLASNAVIVQAAIEAAQRSNLYEGVSVLVTAGPTREPIDPVRFITNRSSGKMGFAIARALCRSGARVTLIAGPSHEAAPPDVERIDVNTAFEMAEAAKQHLSGQNLAICAAAVADFKIKQPRDLKIKGADSLLLELIPNVNVIGTIRELAPSLPVVGFAAETDGHFENAKAKLNAKGLAAIVVNDVSDPAIGFDSDQNAVVLILKDGRMLTIPKTSKFQVALQIIEAVRSYVMQ